MRFAQLAKDFKAVHTGQHDVEHNQVVTGLTGFFQGRFSIMEDDGVMPSGDESAGDMTRKSNFIFNHQNAHMIRIVINRKKICEQQFPPMISAGRPGKSYGLVTFRSLLIGRGEVLPCSCKLIDCAVPVADPSC
jgi:hypothetical protein